MPPKPIRSSIFTPAMFLLAVVFGISAGIAQFTMPVPPTHLHLNGPYPVGMITYDLIDNTRNEILAEHPAGKREIAISIYYPAQQVAGQKPSPFATGPTAEFLSQETGITSQALNAAIQSPIYTSPAVSPNQANYPVLIFSPGWGENPLSYVPTLADMASRGYVIIALWPTYSCDVTIFPDGRVVRATKTGSDPDHYPDEQAQQDVIRDRVGRVWEGDMRFIINEVTRLNESNGLLKGHLAVTHIGLFGHSFGGTVSIQTSKDDPRVVAVANLDGGLFITTPIRGGIPRPLLMLNADPPAVTDAELALDGLTRQQYVSALQQYDRQVHDFVAQARPGFDLRLHGSQHGTYESSLALLAPLIPDKLEPSTVGTISGQRAIKIYDDYLAAFFDLYLTGSTTNLLDGPVPSYPEMVFL